MLKNYLKIAWRNLLRHKNFSLINILGLAIGVATCLLIFFYVEYELGFDRHHSKKERIARVTAGFQTPDGEFNLAVSPTLLADELKRSFPEVQTAARLKEINPVIDLNNELFHEEHFYESENELFDVLDFTIKFGSFRNCLSNPQSVVLTETLSKKYFGNADPIGNTVVMDGKPWKVTAVIKDPPANSDVKISGLRSAQFHKANNWTLDDFDVLTFVLFKGRPELVSFKEKLRSLSARLIQPELDKQDAKEYHVKFGVQMLPDVHYTQGLLDDSVKGNKQLYFMFSLLALFIMIIAILNYINLSTARATERAKEVGVRKVNGARPSQLIRQFLFESFLLISIAWIIAFATALLALPLFNRILGTEISFSWKQHTMFLLIAFLTTLIFAGLYPAFVLTSFKPVEILKGKWRHSHSGILFRKALTVVQFVLTAGLITGAVVIYAQMRYISKKDVGFKSAGVITMVLENDSVSQHSARAMLNSLRSLYGEQNVTAGTGMRGEGMSMGTTFAETEQGKRKELMSAYQFVDKEFISFFDIKLKEGRGLSDSLALDANEGFVVNEAYVKNMQWKNPIGKSMEGFGRKGKIIGVVKNYHYQTLHEMVRPTILLLNPRIVHAIAVKASPGNIPQLATEWKKFFPAKPFEYEFLDEEYAAQYKKDRTTQALYTFFTVLAIIVSMMGLYGLVSLMAVQRAKEIGVRKVLGASMAQLLSLLSKGFMKLIVIASIVAAPIAWYAMNKWLEDYAYHIEISWWMFLLPVVIIVLVAAIVIARQLFTAAVANPVKTLRAE